MPLDTDKLYEALMGLREFATDPRKRAAPAPLPFSEDVWQRTTPRWPLWLDLMRHVMQHANESAFRYTARCLLDGTVAAALVPRVGQGLGHSLQRVADLAAEALQVLPRPARCAPIDPSEHLLMLALKEGQDQDQPVPASWEAWPGVELPVLLVERQAKPMRNGRHRVVQHGTIAQLTLRRAAMPEFAEHSLSLHAAPASFLQQRDADTGGDFDTAFARVGALLRRHLPQARRSGEVLMWDLLIGDGRALPPVGGGSAGGATALAALHLMRGAWPADGPGLELRQHLEMVVWERAAVTARLAGDNDDALGPIAGLSDKLRAWTQERVRDLVPTKVFVASGQPRGRYKRLLEECADVPALVRAVALNTGGGLTTAQNALMQELRQPGPASDERLLAVATENQPAASPRAHLVKRFARLCRPGREGMSLLAPHRLESRFVSLSLSTAPRKKATDIESPQEGQPFDSLAELLSACDDAGAVLLVGQPGGGKTTLLHHLELSAGRAALQNMQRGEDRPEICFWVGLREYKATTQDPKVWLDALVRSQCGVSLHSLLTSHRVRFLFDGINEMRAASRALRDAALRRLCDWIARQRAAGAIPPPVFSVREHHLLILGDENLFVQLGYVQPWKPAQIEAFIAKELGPRAGELWAAIKGDSKLMELSAVPINLAYQCVVFRKLGRVAASRAELFSAIVWLRLREEKPRGTLAADGLLGDSDVEEIDDPQHWEKNLLHLPGEGTLVRWLDQQALAQCRGQAGPDAAVSVMVASVGKEFMRPESERQAWLQAVQELGLAEKEPGRGGRFAYAHQLWLEFFAARAFALGSGADLTVLDGLRTKVEPPIEVALAQAEAAREPLPMLEKSKWEEVLKLAVQLAQAPAQMVQGLIDLDQPMAGRVAAARLDSLRGDSVLEPLRRALHDLSTDPATDLRVRIEAGLVLGELGDTMRYEDLTGREGVIVRVPKPGYWASIEGGDRCTIGSEADDKDGYGDERPVTVVMVKPFRMAWAPVTNAEYRCFLEWGKGYEKEAYWGSGDSLKWFRATGRRQPRRWNAGRYNNPAQPVVGVCLWEAQAYCRWLTRQVGGGHTVYRLPTEAEWETAARGSERHRYPWGDTPPTHEHCNFRATRLGTTSPVGVFPMGDRQIGEHRLADLSGNVFEWTCSRFTAKLDRQALMTPPTDADDNGVPRALRGGGFGYSARVVRGACRFELDPLGDRVGDSGFRVVACPIEFPVP